MEEAVREEAEDRGYGILDVSKFQIKVPARTQKFAESHGAGPAAAAAGLGDADEKAGRGARGEQ